MPDQVPLELNVIPVGNVPAVWEKVIASFSSSVAVTLVKFEADLSLSGKLPKEPLATLNTGLSFVDNKFDCSLDKPEGLVTLIP